MKSFRFGAAVTALCFTAPVAVVAQQTPPLEAYGDLESIESAEISPSGAHSEVVMTVRGQRLVIVFDATGAPKRQFVIGDVEVRAIEWIGDEAILLIRSETGRTGFRFGNRKREWVRANVLPLSKSSEVVSVFADQNRIANAIIGFHGVRQVDGQWKGYFGGFRMGKRSGEDPRILDSAPALPCDSHSAHQRQL